MAWLVGLGIALLLLAWLLAAATLAKRRDEEIERYHRRMGTYRPDDQDGAPSGSARNDPSRFDLAANSLGAAAVALSEEVATIRRLKPYTRPD